jgi:hypothetical protein
MAPASVHRSHRVHHIIVIDASLSMNQKVDETRTAFDIAKLRAVKKINSNPSGDAYSVLLVKDSPTWLVGDPSLHARKVASAIEDAKPSHGNASVATAFSMISAKLKEAEGRYKGNQAIYFFTDMQRSNWLAAAPSTSELRGDDGREKATYLDLQAKAKAGTIFVDCGPSKDNNNLAVTSIGFDQDYFPYITTGLDLVLKATLENFGAEDKRDLRAEVLIGRSREQSSDAAMQMRVVDQQPPLVVPAHSKREIEFLKVKFATPGTYVVQVRLSDDTLEFDNTRSIVVTVRDTIPVLLVNGKSSTDRFERATEYLRIALNPFPPGKEEPGFPLRPSVVSSLQEVSEADLEKFDLVVWADVGHFRGDDVTKMQTHLRRGGGFIVALGDHAAKAANLYNELLYKDEQGLLPAELRKPIAAPAGHHFYLHNADPLAFEKPPLSVFIDQADKLTLQTARFRQYMYAVVPEGS